MSRKLAYVVLSTLSIIVLFIAAIFNGWVPSKPAVEVISVKEVVTMTEPARIDLFINELMTPRKAACLKWILTKESHMNPDAKNPTSTAKGVGQLLDSTYSYIGLKHSADPLAQVIATIAYISRHYGSDGSCAAKAFWQKNFYY
jgi:Transglycosylase SLT domain